MIEIVPFSAPCHAAATGLILAIQRDDFGFPITLEDRHRVARRLLEYLVDIAYTEGMSEIFLGTTERFVAAHRFYEKQGFDRVLEHDLPATFPRMAVDTRSHRLSIPAKP